MLRWRLILGVLLIAALAVVCWLDAVVARPGTFLMPVALMLSWMAVVELLDIFNKRGRQPLPWVLYAGVMVTVLCAGMPLFWPKSVEGNMLAGLGWLAIGLVIGLLLALIGEMRRYDGRWHSTINLGLSAFAVLYVGGLMGFLAQLRVFDLAAAGAADGRWGMLALISLVACVKMSDTGQYVVGRLLGRHKLAPLVSPGKTWEGALGGLLFAIATAWLVFGWGGRYVLGTTGGFMDTIRATGGPLAITLFAAAVAIAGMIGDLAESMLKRDAEVKDSSSWLPGFGGVLDVLDSLLVAAPVAYVFWALGFVGAR